jgi:eukaryotic-like serine/threonine-protein kinase
MPRILAILLGVMLFEMLSGRVPYEADSAMTLMMMHVQQPIPNVQALRPDVPPHLLFVLNRALAKRPDDRFATAGEMAAALRDPTAVPLTSLETQYTTQHTLIDTLPTDITAPTYTPPPPPPPPPPPTAVSPTHNRNRNTLMAAGGAVLLLLLLLTGGYAFWSGSPEPEVDTGATAVAIAAATIEAKITQTAEALPTVTPTNTTPPTLTNTPTIEPSLTPTAIPPILTDSSTAIPPTLTPTATETLTSTADPNLPPSTAELGDVWVRPIDQMNMVYVPQGSFLMGSDDGEEDERPVREVVLDGFWLDRTEMTNAQYQRCVNAGECVPYQPVVGVSWFDAEAYCTWAGGRLPTEAEWEYAARGPDNPTYPWGNTAVSCELAHYGSCQPRRTVEVGSFSPAGDSWVGAVDMAGNVWEWVADWYASDYYQNGATNNPTGPETGNSKVLRGGSWDSNSMSVRSANRRHLTPTYGSNFSFGFRCAHPGQ